MGAWQTLVEFIGDENADKVKDAVTKMIIESIEDTLFYDQLFSSDELKELVLSGAFADKSKVNKE